MDAINVKPTHVQTMSLNLNTMHNSANFQHLNLIRLLLLLVDLFSTAGEAKIHYALYVLFKRLLLEKTNRLEIYRGLISSEEQGKLSAILKISKNTGPKIQLDYVNRKTTKL